MKREKLEKKAKRFIKRTCLEHNFSEYNNGLIKLLCDFAENQLKTK